MTSTTHLAGNNSGSQLEPALMALFQARATAGVEALLISLRDLHVPQPESREGQLCLIFSLDTIELVLSSAFRDGHYDRVNESQYQFELPKTVSKERLLAWIENGHGRTLLKALHSLVNVLHHYLSSDYPPDSYEVMATLRVVQTFSIAISEEFKHATVH